MAKKKAAKKTVQKGPAPGEKSNKGKTGKPKGQGSKAQKKIRKIFRDELSGNLHLEQTQRAISQKALRNPSPADQRTFTIPHSENDPNAVHISINGVTWQLARGEQHTMHKAFYEILNDAGHLHQGEFSQHTIAGRKNRNIAIQDWERGNAGTKARPMKESKDIQVG